MCLLLSAKCRNEKCPIPAWYSNAPPCTIHDNPHPDHRMRTNLGISRNMLPYHASS